MSDSEEESTEQQLKLIFVGESNVGKTCIIKRFCYDEFTRLYSQTIGADFYIKRILLPGKREISIRITDVGGLELNGPMLGNYLFNCDMIILVYDITSCSSFNGMLTWIEAVTKFMEKPKFVAIFGNKCDLEHKRSVRLDKTQHFVREFQLFNFLVSAKTGENINSCLTELIARHFEIPLRRIDREKQSAIVKAELIPTSPEKKRGSTTSVQTNSSVCCIQ